LDGLSAILWRPEGSEDMTCRLVYSTDGLVVVRSGDVLVTSSYISSNVHSERFSDFLEKLNGIVNKYNAPHLICGDFNARSVLWGSPETDRKGELIERWAAASDLRLFNKGKAKKTREQETELQ